MKERYFTISKISVENGVYTTVDLEQTQDLEYVQSVRTNYENTLGSWITENKQLLENNTKSINDFFLETNTDFVLVCFVEVENIVENGGN